MPGVTAPRAVEEPPQTVKAPQSRTMAGNFAAPFADMKGVNEGMERLAARTWDTIASTDIVGLQRFLYNFGIDILELHSCTTPCLEVGRVSSDNM